MSEHEHQSGEQLRGPERSQELEKIAAEALKEIERTAETVTENAAEKLEQARAKIEQQAETPPPAIAEKEKPKAHHPTSLDKKHAYWQTVGAMQRRLKPASRTFSKVIHTPVVEKASDFAGSTIFRPSVTAGATTTALIVGAFFYITARHYGFGLRGSEFIVSLAAGAIIGLMIELLAKPFRK